MRRKRPLRLGQRSAGDVIDAVLGKYGLVVEVREQRVINEWQQIVGA